MKDKKKELNKIISSLSLEKKVAQMMQLPYSCMTKEQAFKWAERGLGSFLHVLGDNARELQKIAIESGNMPLIFGIDAIHGHCLNDNATIFPTQLSMACSFNPELIKQMASATAEEVSADGLHWTFSPVLCLGRDIRWGRVAETFGEDKFLAGELGRAMIEGYQGESLSDEASILACAKHYIGYGEATGAKDAYDTEITERKMRSEFLPPFEKAVEANCATVMTAYGSLDGVPCTTDKRLLTEILKEELGFNGFIVTDWNNISNLIYLQFVADNFIDASELAIKAGNDMMMSTEKFYEATIELVKSGQIDEKLIDEAVFRILSAKYDLGLMDNPYKGANSDRIGCKEHIDVNRKLADECVVLLKNDGVLPLKDKKKIAVIGESADDIRRHYGDWTYFTHPNPNQGATPKKPYVTLLEGIKNIAQNKDIEIVYSKGYEMLSDDLSCIDDAVETAKQCDLIIFACGDTYEHTGEGKDRANLSLTLSQRVAFERLSKLDKPIVTVLISSKPLCVAETVDNSSAFLTCFNGGMFGGEALAKTIFGELNPSGKLPISFPYDVGQQPSYYNYLPGWHSGKYVDMPQTSLFAFGEGLSYSDFEYSNLSFDENELELSVTVKNVGEIAGKETAQVYFRDLFSRVITPVKQLIAFRKIELKAKEEKTLIFKFNERDFSLVNVDCKRIMEKGDFEIMVGGSSKDQDLLKVNFRKK